MVVSPITINREGYGYAEKDFRHEGPAEFGPTFE
jgi:hypothetical protein